MIHVSVKMLMIICTHVLHFSSDFRLPHYCWAFFQASNKIFFIFQYRISNIKFNVSSGPAYPVPDKSAPIYVTVGDGGNKEGLAER